MVPRFILILLCSYNICTNTYACNQNERSSLLSFAGTLLSSPPSNWTSTSCCHWKGITCNQDGLVTHLHLPSSGLKGGMFTSSLANLTNLTHLNLSHNSLYGSLDTRFFLSLIRLEILDLSYNLLSGELPLSLPSTNIRVVDFSSNHFHGGIPSTFFQQASNLTIFNVSNNIFSGSIPSSICLHSSPILRALDFSSNEFSGIISPGLGLCSKLQIFRAGHNRLSGLIPEDIYNATKLEEIAMPLNSIYGSISEKIVNLTNLAILDLYYNHLSGGVPLNFGKLSKLRFMNLDFNNLEGFLPPSFLNCTNLVEIHLASNNLEGDISMLNFSKLGQLTKIDLFDNNFTGTLPISLYSCSYLKAIRLSENDLEGQIQPEIVSLKSLSLLSLGYNRFTNLTGAIKILMGCKSLQTLLLSGSFKGEGIPVHDGLVGFDGFQNVRFLTMAFSELTGEMPAWLSKMKNLEVLAMNDNRITGPIPSWLGTLKRLFAISLANNLISGQFPKELCTLPSLVYDLHSDQKDRYDLELSIFNRTAKIPIFLPHRLSYFPPIIDLYNNNINGNIPTEIGQLQRLHELDLGRNNFSGEIPDQISNLKNLETLILSENELSGRIPPSMTDLNFLKAFDVSYNNLEGPIPTSTQLQSFSASLFEGNPNLCGAPLPKMCHSRKGIDVADDNKDGHQLIIPWFYVFTTLGFIVGFWGVCGSLIISKAWRRAYFQFIDNVQDWLYVMIKVSVGRWRRLIRRS